MKNKINSNPSDEKFNLVDDEIDLRYILNFLFRNIKIISFFTFILFVLGCFYGLSKKRIWEGRFEIVLKTEKSINDEINLNSDLSRLVGFDNRSDNNLQTEIGILESPSVLMPIFEYVNSEKISSEIDNKQFKFFKWKDKNLSFDLKKGTSILNIAYQDTDKDVILPVLNKILLTYQDYSGRNKRRSQELAKTYLNSQIDEYKIKSSKSIKKAQEFSIDEDLYPLEFLKGREGIQEIESLRVKSANKIRKLQLQIEKIIELENDSNTLQYVSVTLPILVENGLAGNLTKIDEELLRKRALYRENDKSIQLLLLQKKKLIEYLTKNAIGSLNALILEEEAVMAASMRPKGVLLKYKELVREARRDETTLINLEDQLRILELEEAKLEDPWELITQPTLLKDPVAPSRTSIAFFAASLGFLLGSLIAFFRERNLDIIYEPKIIQNILNSEVIDLINKNDLDINSEKNSLICDYIKNQFNKDEKLSFFTLGEIDTDKLNIFNENLSNYFRNDLKESNFLISIESKLSDFLKANQKILVLFSSKIKYTELINFKKRLKFNSSDISGVIIFK